MWEFIAPSTWWEQQYNSFGLWGPIHLSLLGLLVALIVLVIVFRKKISNQNHIKKYLEISLYVWGVLEIIKITMFFITTTNITQGLREVLPLYMCSIFLYALPLSVFGKGIFKDIGDYFLVTLSIIGGVLTLVNSSVLNNYPEWSFYSLHSLLFHMAMAVTGALLLSTGYIKLEIKKFYLPMFLIVITAVPAVIMNNIVNTDYMLMHHAWGAPILQDIAAAMGQVFQIFLMLFLYALLSFLAVGLYYLVEKIIKTITSKSPSKNRSRQNQKEEVLNSKID